MNYKNKLQIDLIDMIHQVLKKWRVLFVWMIVGAVVVSIYGYMNPPMPKAEDETVTADTTVDEEAPKNIVEMREKLTDDQVLLIEETANMFIAYYTEYKQYLSYGEKSIVMQLDAHSVPKRTNAYVISELDENSKKSPILYSYQRELTTAEVAAKIKKELGIEGEDVLATELVNVTVQDGNTLLVSAIGMDDEMCSKVMRILDETVQSASKNLQDIATFELSLVNSYFTSVTDTSIVSAQKDYMGYVYTVRANMNNLVNLLPSIEEKTYYNELISLVKAKLLENEGNTDEEINVEDIYEEKKVEIEAKGTDEDIEEPVEEEVIVEKKFSISFVIVGLIIGLILSMIWYVIKYVLSAKLHMAEDLHDVFGTTLLGEIFEYKREPNLVDRAISKKFGDSKALPLQEQQNLIFSGIDVAANKQAADRVLLMGTSEDSTGKAYMLKIAENVKCTVEIIENSVVNDHNAIEKLSNADAVVLVEKIDGSKYDDIAREVELCQKFGVKILGAVAVR